MVVQQMHRKYLSKKAAANYLGVPMYVLTALERIGRLSPDKGFLFWKQYAVQNLDRYRRDAQVDTWKNNKRLLQKLKHQKTA